MTSSSPEATSQAALASQVASLLSVLAPTAALENEPFRLALQGFIGRGDSTFQEEVTIWLGSRKRRKKTPSRPHLEHTARQFFEDCKQEAGKSFRGTCCKDLLQGLICLHDACKLSADDYKAMWEHSRRNTTSVELLGANRQRRAIEKENLTESKAWVIESQRRLDLLHVEYEIRRLLPQNHGAGKSGCESEHAIAEREFSKLADVDISQTRAKRRNVRPYLHLAKYEHGLGLMLLLGVQTRKQWERTITNQGISWILEFCEEEEAVRGVFGLARELQPLACSMVKEGFSFCGTDPTELQETNHILSAHFQGGTPLQAHGGLDTLAAAAGALQTHGSTTERRSSKSGTHVQRAEHLYEAPRTEHTTFLQSQQGDERATPSLGGITLTSDVIGHEAASRRDAFRSSLDVGGVGESSYPGTSANLTNWRPANQGQYMWQESEVTDSNWGVWWEDWNLGGINAPLISDDQSAF